MVASSVVLNNGGGGDRVAADFDPATGLDTLSTNINYDISVNSTTTKGTTNANSRI